MDFIDDGIAVDPKVQNSAPFAPGTYKRGQLVACLASAWNDGEAEVIELTITGTADSNGSAAVVINGATAVPIAYTSGDTAADIAALIAAGSFTGWTSAAVGAVVTFTAGANEEKTGVDSIVFTDADTEPSEALSGAFVVDTEGRDNSAAGDYATYDGTDETYGLATIKAVVIEDSIVVYPGAVVPIAKGEFSLVKVAAIMAALDTPVTLSDALLAQCFAAGIILN